MSQASNLVYRIYQKYEMLLRPKGEERIFDWKFN